MGADGKPLAFDVVSIREDKSDPTPQNPVKNGPTPDGYRLKDMPLLAVIPVAYVPSQGTFNFGPNQITGVPACVYSIRYDVDARVSEVDLPKWKDPTLQAAMLRAMLQAMFADRFKLAVHRETKEVPIYELTRGRKGPKFKPL
ncbi:MAG TPA: TIGR03435 family protein [Acidobacteriaceae bacterium]|nr:TIGR03435 family protein [Acidobacteriaceae bacterium]